MTPQSEAEGVDFKPFFDLIIGVLFIFLILIAAQMFFTQWAPTHNENRDWEREVSEFLEKLAGALRQVGLTTTVDNGNRTIAVPLQELMATQGGGRPHFLSEPAASFGQQLEAHLSCVSRATPSRAECSPFRLDLRHLQADVRLDGMPTGTQLAQDRYAKLVATEFAAGVFGETPQLLGLTGSNGNSLIDISSSAAATPRRDGLQGDIALRFTFDPSAGPMGP